MGRIRRRHATNTGNRIGTFNMLCVFFEKRRAKVLLSLKPKPCQTAAISGKQNLAQRRSKRRRDHQRLLSKLRNIIPRIVQTTSIGPKVTSGSRREAPQLPAALRSPQRRQARSAEAAAGTRARNSHAPPHQPSGLNQQRPHRRPLAAASPQAGAGLSFQNTPQSSLAIWTALVAAPLRIWSPQHQKVMPRAASGFEMSRRTRPTQIRS